MEDSFHLIVLNRYKGEGDASRYNCALPCQFQMFVSFIFHINISLSDIFILCI